MLDEKTELGADLTPESVNPEPETPEETEGTNIESPEKDTELEEKETTESEETDEASEDETSESEDDEEKADGAQKRINKLVAQKKALEEKLQDSEAELSRERKRREEDWEYLQEQVKSAQGEISDPITYNGKPMYLLDDEEFSRVEDEVIDGANESHLKALKVARQQRREYLKSVSPYLKDIQETRESIETNFKAELKEIGEALVSINPEYSEYFEDIQKSIDKELKNPLKSKRWIFGTLQDKAYYVDKITEELGIKQKLENKLYAAERPKPSAPVSTGKVKKSNPAGIKTQTFTREQIKRMPLDEFLKHESEIDKATREGRVV